MADPVLPLLDPTEAPDLPQPAPPLHAEAIVARSVVARPHSAPLLGFAVDSAVIIFISTLAIAGLGAGSPATLSQGLPAPIAGIGLALVELALSSRGPVWPILLVLFGCSLALALAGGRAILRRVQQANAPRRLVVGPPREVSRFVGGADPLDGAVALVAAGPRPGKPESGVPQVELPRLVLAEPIDEVLLLRGWKSRERHASTFDDCREVGVDVAVELDIEPAETPEGARLERRGDRLVAHYTFVPRKGPGRTVKWALEYTTALVLAIAALPLMALIALAIKLTSPGPIVFRQMRTGLNGRRIPCFKFRTMVDGAHAAQRKLAGANEITGSSLLFKMDNDPRVTPVGRFLRCTSLDELPQLFNVLRGELSLIGPRLLSIPLSSYQPAHRRRLSVRPGIACTWQAWHRGETDFGAWMRSDLDYLDRWSLGRDFRILMRTAWVVLRREGAR